MNLSKLLVANRGEIAIRILRTAADLGVPAVAIYSEDDANSLHTRRAGEALALRGRGVSAYLDGEQILALAAGAGCDAIHPGYGFLSENSAFARSCAGAGITFVGPTPAILDLFGDKVLARALAQQCGVPILPGTSGPTTVAEAKGFLASLGDGGAVMIKAVAGGGGRGMRAVGRLDDVEAAFARCRSEALQAFGNGDLFVEQVLTTARHVEIQVIGDRAGSVSHLGERECSIQRRHQKLVEMAPSPSLPGGLRERLVAAAVTMAESVHYESLGTFEFLVDATEGRGGDDFAFIEVNPRLQVEHTVTEEVTGIDLVKAQLLVSAGCSLAELGLQQSDVPPPRGLAMQVRINMETMGDDGSVRPAGGALTAFDIPSGPGVRVDTFGYVGYRTNPAFDSLLAKLVVRAQSDQVADVVGRTHRALSEFNVTGVATNIDFLLNLLSHSDVVAGRVYTDFVADHIGELAMAGSRTGPDPFLEQAADGGATRLAGAKVDPTDPLAVLAHGKRGSDGGGGGSGGGTPEAPEGSATAVGVRAPMQGTVVSIEVAEGDLVPAGRPLLVLEAMKMEHVITAGVAGIVRRLEVVEGDTVVEDHLLAVIEMAEVSDSATAERDQIDLAHIRPDLAEVHQRHEIGLDAARPDAVATRRATGQRTARENIADLCDPGTFVEYGALVIAAQRRRRPLAELIERTPADGLVGGIGGVNGHQCVVMSYDYTVLAGTQGLQNHRKKDRLFELAAEQRLPVVVFTEGGGGRPGDTDGTQGDAGFRLLAFHLFGRLSGLVPLVGIASGRCFAGNAALLGCCDVVIATADSNIGMGGPAMIEGGGLGVFRPEEIGPMRVQVANGVVDLPVADEAAAVQAAKRYLGYFQGPTSGWECADQRLLRRAIPENRVTVYDVRVVIDTMADTGSVLELRRNFGPGMVTALMRVEGRPLGVIANNPVHLAGAIDSQGADKAARFMQLCDAFDLPILFLCDTPGIMVGPEIEKSALVRHSSRMFVTGANLRVPFFTIVLRKSYGLGALAMAGGSFSAPQFTISWPTGEFGGMGLEGAVKLGYRKELAALEDPAERRALFDRMVARMYEQGKALNAASLFELDDVIDPIDSRRWIMTALQRGPATTASGGKRRPLVDTW